MDIELKDKVYKKIYKAIHELDKNKSKYDLDVKSLKLIQAENNDTILCIMEDVFYLGFYNGMKHQKHKK